MVTTDSKTIFVADDSVFFRTKLSDILVEAGHKVIFAKDGRDLIAKINAADSRIDLLILDLQMPEIDGFGVLKWLKESGCNDRFPVLVATGAFEATAVVNNLRELGASGFMSKGSTPEQIIFRVHSLLFPDKKTRRSNIERVPISTPADFTHGDNPAQTGFIQNIGEGGTFLHTNVSLLVGTKLRLRFSLPGIDRVFHLSGAVEWSTYDSPAAHRTLFGGYGVMFMDITDDERDALNGFVKEELSKLSVKKL
ncbi:MAG: hypothetical protein A3J24_02485 [Deltaproteobacteria bacterium RIFCSPLOWO2_02_FULL_53_8]|nr:MAG: hypothetical protein A3J24_02485 [Deltaproteobacteria bacterium RIFCSPLOWO2_02_FULL_53_8]